VTNLTQHGHARALGGGLYEIVDDPCDDEPEDKLDEEPRTDDDVDPDVVDGAVEDIRSHPLFGQSDRLQSAVERLEREVGDG
jgi:hypothetical protein